MTWKRRLARAKKTGYFTWEDWEKAMWWESCAVHERPNVKTIPETNRPSNPCLSRLGVQFMQAIHANAVEEAAHIYCLIRSYPQRGKI